MTLVFEDESTRTLPFEGEQAAQQVIQAALDYVKCPYEAEINLLLTDDEEIHAINRQFREIDRATDVLSFPALEYEQAGQFEFVEELGEEYFNPDSGELLLGDMMISLDRVFSQSEEYGHSVLREYSFLIAHSMLHLFGYDHIRENEAAQMERMQTEILEEIGITRD